LSLLVLAFFLAVGRLAVKDFISGEKDSKGEEKG